MPNSILNGPWDETVAKDQRICLTSNPIIDIDTPVVTIGSCFAKNLVNFMQAGGMNIQPASVGRVYNPVSILNTLTNCLQQRPLQPAEIKQDALGYTTFRYGFIERFSSAEDVLRFVDGIEASMKFALESSNVIIITLGMTEAYVDSETNEVVTNVNKLKNLKFGTRSLNFAACYEVLEQIRDLLKSIRKDYKIVLTVSPVALKSTFRDQHHLVTNGASKATLRAVCNEIVQQYDDVFYFPAYDIITEELLRREDLSFKVGNFSMHPSQETISIVMSRFCEGFIKDSKEFGKEILINRFHKYHQVLLKVNNPEAVVTARDIELCKELIEELQHVTANKRSMHGVMLLEYNKASLLLRLGDNDAAEAGFKLVRSILSEYSDLIRKSFSRFDSGSSFYLGEIAKKRGQNKLAKEYFAKAIETVPNHRMANAALASCS